MEYYGKNITIKGVIGELGCKSLLRFDLLVSYRLVEHWQRMDISLMRILPGVDLDKINKASNVYRKDKRGNRIRWEFITWKNLYWRNSIGHDDDYDSIMQFGNRTHLVYSFRSNHIAIIGRYIEFHQYLYGIYDETF